MSSTRERWIVGCMTGTSLDGLDAALCHITGEGRDMRARFVAMASHPLGELASVLRSMAGGQTHAPFDYMTAARRLGELHVQAVADLCRSVTSRGAKHNKVDFVVAHGQTIWHAPSRQAHGPGLSWQLFDPWPLVREFGVPACYDLRQADLIAGGQGAPITPLADWVMYRDRAQAVANLGGICNITLLDKDPERIQARDVGPCNLLLDGLCQRCAGEPFDRDGLLAGSGRVVAEVRSVIETQVSEMTGRGASSAKQSPAEQQSLGREQFSEAWLDGLVEKIGPAISPADLLRSAVEATAGMIVAQPHEAGCRDLVLAGGGVRNKALIQAIREHTGSMNVRLSDELGVPCEAREAMAMAVLGALSQDGVPITLPQVTGAHEPGIAGIWAGLLGFGV